MAIPEKLTEVQDDILRGATRAAHSALASVNTLRPQDRVSIVVYAGASGQVLGPTSGAQVLAKRVQ